MTDLNFGEAINSYIVGGCGFKPIKDQWTLEFNRENFLLGFEGVPDQKWLAVSPFTVVLRDFYGIESLDPAFEVAPITEYYLSPASKKRANSAFIAYPSYIQTPYCVRSINYSIRLDTFSLDTGVMQW